LEMWLGMRVPTFINKESSEGGLPHRGVTFAQLLVLHSSSASTSERQWPSHRVVSTIMTVRVGTFSQRVSLSLPGMGFLFIFERNTHMTFNKCIALIFEVFFPIFEHRKEGLRKSRKKKWREKKRKKEKENKINDRQRVFIISKSWWWIDVIFFGAFFEIEKNWKVQFPNVNLRRLAICGKMEPEDMDESMNFKTLILETDKKLAAELKKQANLPIVARKISELHAAQRTGQDVLDLEFAEDVPEEAGEALKNIEKAVKSFEMMIRAAAANSLGKMEERKPEFNLLKEIEEGERRRKIVEQMEEKMSGEELSERAIYTNITLDSRKATFIVGDLNATPASIDEFLKKASLKTRADGKVLDFRTDADGRKRASLHFDGMTEITGPDHTGILICGLEYFDPNCLTAVQIPKEKIASLCTSDAHLALAFLEEANAEAIPISVREHKGNKNVTLEFVAKDDQERNKLRALARFLGGQTAKYDMSFQKFNIDIPFSSVTQMIYSIGLERVNLEFKQLYEKMQKEGIATLDLRAHDAMIDGLITGKQHLRIGCRDKDTVVVVKSVVDYLSHLMKRPSGASNKKTPERKKDAKRNKRSRRSRPEKQQRGQPESSEILQTKKPAKIWERSEEMQDSCSSMSPRKSKRATAKELREKGRDIKKSKVNVKEK